MYETSNIAEAILNLCDQKGIPQTVVEKELGWGRGSIGKMKTSSPTIKKIAEFCNYFGVTMEYLLTGEDSPVPVRSVPLTDQERELLGIFRDMNREGKEKLLSLAKDLSQIYKKDGGQAQTA